VRNSRFVACYSGVPIYQLDEYVPAYSTCCGDAVTLPNGNIEFDMSFDVNTPNASCIEKSLKPKTPSWFGG
jgi:hypothetical protein